MHAQTPTPSHDQRLEALEYFLGQALLALEADSVATHARLDRLEAALKKAALFAAFSVTGKGTQSSYPSIEQFNEFLTLNE